MIDWSVALAVLAGVCILFGVGIVAFFVALKLVQQMQKTASASVVPAVEQEKTRKLPVVSDVRICRYCDHFDLELGQKVLGENPIFFAATRHIPPNRMGLPLATDEKGDVLPPDKQPKGPLSTRENNWDFFGACLKKDIVLHRTDTCEDFTPKAAELAAEQVQ